MLFRSGEVTIIDESPSEGVRGLMLDHVFLTVLSQEDEGPLADIQISGRIHRPERGSTFNIGGRLEPKPIEVGSPSLASQPRSHRWQFAGQIDVSDLDIGEIANLFQLHFKPSHARDQMGYFSIELIESLEVIHHLHELLVDLFDFVPHLFPHGLNRGFRIDGVHV